MLSRRQALALFPLFALSLAARRGSRHPTPRPGITAARVLTRADLGDDQQVLELFDMVREIPEIIDGIFCYCGCDDVPDHYSLLSCYEDGMAQTCEICQGEARLAYELHRKGSTLGAIRTAIDKKFA